jgi:hypothetical protein
MIYLYFSVEVEVTLRLTVGQSVCLGDEPTVGLVTWKYFLSEGYCLKLAVLFLWGASLTRGRVCSLQCNHSIAESRRTRNHNIACRLRLSQPGGSCSVFKFQRKRMAQLYPRALGFLFKVRSYFTTHSQSVSTSWCRAPSWDLQPHITSCQYVSAWSLRACFYGPPSLTWGCVCNCSAFA